MTDQQEAGKIFIWGQVGKQLQTLDKKRMLAIIQDKPNIHLSRLANDEILTASDKLFEGDDITVEQLAQYRKTINKTNDLDNTFRQTAHLLKDSQDMLSIGSAMTGEIENKKGYLKIHYGGE